MSEDRSAEWLAATGARSEGAGSCASNRHNLRSARLSDGFLGHFHSLPTLFGCRPATSNDILHFLARVLVALAPEE